MKNKLKIYALIIAALVLMTSCSSASGGSGSSSTVDSTVTSVSEVQADNTVNSAAVDTEGLFTWDAESSTYINFDGNSAEIKGDGAAADSAAVSITKAGTYVVTGTTENGSININAQKDDVVRIVLNNASITNTTGCAIYSQQAGNNVIILADGSQNILSDAASYAQVYEEEPNGALFAQDDMAIGGNGSLNVSGNYENGISSKDHLTIASGVITVTAVNDGIRGKDSITIIDGEFNINATEDGIKSNNDTDPEKGNITIDGGTFNIVSGNDGIQAETELTVNGGNYNITTGGGYENASAKETDAAMEQRWQNARGGGAVNENAEMPQMGEGMTPPTNEDGTLPADGEFTMPERPDGEMPEGMQMPDGQTVPDVAGQASSEESTTTENGASDDSSADTSESTAAEETESTSCKALKAGTLLTVNNGSFTINAEDDSFHSNTDLVINGGSFSVQTGDDAVHADNAVTINDGSFDIKNCYEGVEGSTIDINGGTITLNASDDGINASDGSATDGFGGMMQGGNSSLYIRFTGGTVNITAQGDGVDSNGNLYFDGGIVNVVCTSPGADSAIDADGTIETGGTALTATSTGTQMLQVPSDSSSTASVTVVYTQTQKAGTKVELKDSQGNVISEVTPSADFQTILISASGLETSQTYTLYSSDTLVTDITLSGTVTSVSSDGSEYTVQGNGMGMGGGGRGSFGGGERPSTTEGGNTGETTITGNEVTI